MQEGDPRPGAWPPSSGPFADVNERFHEAYDASREKAETDAPVFVLLGDSLFVCRRDDTREVPVAPRELHILKAAAHAPVALFAALVRSEPGALGEATRTRVALVHAACAAALGDVDRELGRAAMAADARAVLEATRQFATELSSSGTLERERLQAFARAMGPRLLALTDHASEVQLVALHDAVETALASIAASERNQLQVVVAGAHQARDRSLGMQYFRKRLGEAPDAEDRVAYAENAATVDEALALVGTRRLDRAIARAFFGDDKRLQRDVLGDSAAEKLAAFSAAPIGRR